jgi:carbon monoxide dehydrogenase subunit G
MKLTGEANLRAGVDQVYAALTDPAILVRAIPGCQRLEQVGEDSYKAAILAGVGSIKGVFDGSVRLSDRDAPHGFTLHASGTGVPGTVSAVARMTLAEADGGTLVRYDADATIGGVIGGVGQRMITGVARRTAAEFFAAVDREIAAPAPALAPSAAAVAGPSAAPSSVAPSSVAPSSAAAAGVWMAPVPPVDLARQRMRDLLVGAAFGAAVALLGVLVGAIVAGW